MTKAIVISASSDIGIALCEEWHQRGWELFGTYRTPVEKSFAKLTYCDLSDVVSIEKACKTLVEACKTWDVLVFGAGDLKPVGDFAKVDFDQWEEGIQINLLRQLRILHHLLPYRSAKPSVLFFAGGGTNNAVPHYSSYTLSKIALIKMTELLDAELPDTRFVILGPGCVKTKIHAPTLEGGEAAAGANYQRTLDRLNNNECTPMKDVVDSCTWLITTPCDAVGGRNFSTVGDQWGTFQLEDLLKKDLNMYKLRRSGN